MFTCELLLYYTQHKKAKILREIRLLASLNVPMLLTEVWFRIFIVYTNEQSRKLSGLSSWLASYNLLCSFSISLSSLKKNPDKHLPNLVSFQEKSGWSVNLDSEGSCLKMWHYCKSFANLTVLIWVQKCIIIFMVLIVHIWWCSEAHVEQNSHVHPSVCTTVFVKEIILISYASARKIFILETVSLSSCTICKK